MPDGGDDQVRSDVEALLPRQDQNVPHCANDSPTHAWADSRICNVRLDGFSQAEAVLETVPRGTDIQQNDCAEERLLTCLELGHTIQHGHEQISSAVSIKVYFIVSQHKMRVDSSLTCTWIIILAGEHRRCCSPCFVDGTQQGKNFFP